MIDVKQNKTKRNKLNRVISETKNKKDTWLNQNGISILWFSDKSNLYRCIVWKK